LFKCWRDRADDREKDTMNSTACLTEQALEQGASAMHKVWIEAALNGPWSRALQPGIPDTVEAIVAEGIACARAGATIIHTHAYDGGGAQTFDWQVYARIIEGIRAQVDVPVYPSYPSILATNIDAGFAVADAAARFAHIEALAARGLLEFAVIDPGSVNFTLTATTSGAKPAGTYMNPESHVRHALDFAARHGFHPAFAIYEPGFTRAGAALARAASKHRSTVSYSRNNLPSASRPSPTRWPRIWRCWRRKRARRHG